MGTTNHILHLLHWIAEKTYKLRRYSFEARLIEYDFVLSNFESIPKMKILDCGCGNTNFLLPLMNHSNEIWGIDIHPREKTPFQFILGNLEKMPFKSNYFDIISAVSTIEHVGLGKYGDPLSQQGDVTAIDEIKRVLRSKGKLLMTIPAGIDTICYSEKGEPLHRVYSPQSIGKLLADFQILELSYIIKKGPLWCPASITETEKKAKSESKHLVGTTSIALIVAEKEEE